MTTGEAPQSGATKRFGTKEYGHHRRARVMAKRFGRPSLHYRYEHYDPR